MEPADLGVRFTGSSVPEPNRTDHSTPSFFFGANTDPVAFAPAKTFPCKRGFGSALTHAVTGLARGNHCELTQN